MTRLAPFPPGSGAAAPAPGALVSRGITLRPAREADLPGLRKLYADTRAGEMAMAPWPQALKDDFLDQQFALQHQHYVAHYATADFLVIEQGPVLVGRLYLQRSPPDHLVVDISLFEAWRGQGLGHALLEAVQAEAAGLGRGVILSVMHGNPGARRLYLRLGFVPDGGTSTHEHMAWRPSLS